MNDGCAINSSFSILDWMRSEFSFSLLAEFWSSAILDQIPNLCCYFPTLKQPWKLSSLSVFLFHRTCSSLFMIFLPFFKHCHSMRFLAFTLGAHDFEKHWQGVFANSVCWFMCFCLFPSPVCDVRQKLSADIVRASLCNRLYRAYF